MTEEFKNQIQKSIEEALKETYVKIKDENRMYLKKYEELVLEAIKSYDFSEDKFIEKELVKKEDLVGKPDKVSIYFTGHYHSESDKPSDTATIEMEYYKGEKEQHITDSLIINREVSTKPSFLEKETYNYKYMDELLKEQGIDVRFSDFLPNYETYRINFDSSELNKAISNFKSRKLRKSNNN